MAKKSRTRPEAAAPVTGEGQVAPRQPCPCGSGKRYKSCHGGADGGATAYVARPYAGLAMECDLVALKELVPAATAPLTLKDDVSSPQGSRATARGCRATAGPPSRRWATGRRSRGPPPRSAVPARRGR